MSMKATYEKKLQAQRDQWRAEIDSAWGSLGNALKSATARFK